MNADYFAANSLVWPLTFMVVALFALRKVGDEVQPVFRGMRDALAQQASKNAQAWAMAMMMGASASMQAMVDVFHTLATTPGPLGGWFYAEATARIIGPGLIAVIALFQRSPTAPNGTTPPFPPKP